MRIPRALHDELVAHALEDAPNECCGMVTFDGPVAAQVHRARNIHASPFRYEIDPADSARVFASLEESGQTLGIVYHSHTRSDPIPSQTDINLANPLLGDVLYVIVGVKDPERPDVRAWRIADGAYEPAELTVE